MENGLGSKKTMAKNIQRFLNESGKTRKELAAAIEVPYTTVCAWINARTYPRIDKIELMAQFFGIQKKDLVEDSVVASAWDDMSPRARDAFKRNYDALQNDDYGSQKMVESIDMLFSAVPGATEEELAKTAAFLNFLKTTRKE